MGLRGSFGLIVRGSVSVAVGLLAATSELASGVVVRTPGAVLYSAMLLASAGKLVSFSPLRLARCYHSLSVKVSRCIDHGWGPSWSRLKSN